MSAFDPTVQPDDVELRLRSWMADQRADADLTSTYARIVERTGSSSPRRRFLVRPSLTRTSPPTTWSYRWGRLAPIVILALLLGLAIGAGILVGSRLVRNDPPAIEIEGRRELSAYERVTSHLFQPKVTFTVTPRSLGQTAGDICPFPITSARTIVLAHPKGCVEDLRFIRPWAVACGTADDHPDAAALAAAILAIPGTRPAVDLGDRDDPETTPTACSAIRTAAVSSGCQAGARRSSRTFPIRTTAGCSRSLAPTIRRSRSAADIGAHFILLDVDGELVVIRASLGTRLREPRGGDLRGYGAPDGTSGDPGTSPTSSPSFTTSGSDPRPPRHLPQARREPWFVQRARRSPNRDHPDHSRLRGRVPARRNDHAGAAYGGFRNASPVDRCALTDRAALASARGCTTSPTDSPQARTRSLHRLEPRSRCPSRASGRSAR